MIVDTDSGECTAHKNLASVESISGVSVQVGKAVVDLGLSALIRGCIEHKSPGILQAGVIEVYGGVIGTVQNALRRFQASQLRPIRQRDAPARGAAM